MTLGLSQLKRWVYLLSAGDQDEAHLSDSEEFIKISFMRASFASELQKYVKKPVFTRSEAYLLGMFSTLEYLIDAPMEEILADIPMVDELKSALLHREGQGGLLLELVISYEKADWKKITEDAELLDIPSAQLATIYFNCMEEVNRIWDQMLNPSPAAKQDAVEEQPTEQK